LVCERSTNPRSCSGATEDQRQELRDEAARQDLTLQELLEIKISGKVQPCVRKRANAPPGQGALALTA
jgi:hypothetical protein